MRRILRASGLMGTASAATIAAGVVRAKILALLIGAEGIGLFGLFQSFQGLVAAVAGLGVPASGVREVALARAGADHARLRSLKSSILGLPIATGVLVIAGAGLLRRPIARHLFDDVTLAPTVVVLAVGIAALTVSLSQAAWINGLRRVSALARLRILTALGGAALTILLVWRHGLAAVAWAVAGASVLSLAVTSWYWRDPEGMADSTMGSRRESAASLVRLGLPLMTAGLLAPATHLAVRSLLLRRLGAESLGHWQAAWSLSMIYVGFVLAAMAVDYLPRLSELAAEPQEMARVVNEQARVALLLACPVVLAMMAAAPWVVRLLYSRDFDPAASILAWQLIGDLFKVPAWALAMVFAALGRGGGHLLAETLWNLPFLALVWFGAERWGLAFCGVAFLLAYAFYLLGLWVAMRRTIGFRWAPGTLTLLFAGVAAAAAMRWLAPLGGPGLAAQGALVLAFAVHSYYRIRQGLADEPVTSDDV